MPRAASGLATWLAGLPVCSPPQTGQNASRTDIRRRGVEALIARSNGRRVVRLPAPRCSGSVRERRYRQPARGVQRRQPASSVASAHGARGTACSQRPLSPLSAVASTSNSLDASLGRERDWEGADAQSNTCSAARYSTCRGARDGAALRDHVRMRELTSLTQFAGTGRRLVSRS